MTTFDDRENAFESKYAHDAEMAFKAAARRNKALGAWAAGLLGLTGDAVGAYQMEVITADFEEEGDEDVLRKLVKDLQGKATEAEIRAQMLAIMRDVKAKMVSEG
ncbi:DUF1476 domain-containing protein [Pararhodobacter aggregans]|uniref:DUF1476 domain-containing protein n=1 Tax=Pararhodobacter aggregans TaxID=404875 RepID=A0A2T7UX84_9RHOB|nr:DUF1476 domain-containing protein [Pararhodobacter aggregans]PTX04971.1 hypothetical protein C8N33_101384 [Pararhodobacter aggregans]PVE49292.1 DUF1476 domain-containing protein [Pararhodobacter aggregans]